MSGFNIGDSRVIESREVSDGVAIRRRRETPDGRRFTTYERVEKPNLIVIKKNGSRELFDRVKLAHAVRQSVGKFLKSDEEVRSLKRWMISSRYWNSVARKDKNNASRCRIPGGK